MKNIKTGKVYSSKFQLSVVDLTKIDIATPDDIAKKRHLWAAFFKAKSWEELLMLATKDSNIDRCVTKIRQLSEEEKFRQRCEAREDLLRQQRDMELYFTRKDAHQKEEIASQKEEIASQKEEIASQKEEIASQKEEIASQKEEIASQKEEIASQKEELELKNAKLQSYCMALRAAGIDPDMM